jgi:hypothetical protein
MLKFQIFLASIPANPKTIPRVIQRQHLDRLAVFKSRGRSRSSRTAFAFASSPFAIALPFEGATVLTACCPTTVSRDRRSDLPVMRGRPVPWARQDRPWRTRFYAVGEGSNRAGNCSSARHSCPPDCQEMFSITISQTLWPLPCSIALAM